MAPLEQPPFYAVRVVAGELGTLAGIATNAHAQVIEGDGVALEGLYAVGNDAANVMGGTYPGAGITIGPAMTFGYVAVRHLAASQNRAPTAPNNGACVGSAREQRVEFADRVELIKLATAANMGLPDPNLRHAAATIGFARHLPAQG